MPEFYVLPNTYGQRFTFYLYKNKPETFLAKNISECEYSMSYNSTSKTFKPNQDHDLEANCFIVLAWPEKNNLVTIAHN